MMSVTWLKQYIYMQTLIVAQYCKMTNSTPYMILTYFIMHMSMICIYITDFIKNSAMQYAIAILHYAYVSDTKT